MRNRLPLASAAARRILTTESTAMPLAALRTKARRCVPSPPIASRRCSVSGSSAAISRAVRRRSGPSSLADPLFSSSAICSR